MDIQIIILILKALKTYFLNQLVTLSNDTYVLSGLFFSLV